MKDRNAVREHLLAEGKKAFMEKGYGGAYLRDIASDAGVTTGAIYAHYKDKDALFVDLVSPVLEGFKAELRRWQDVYHDIDNTKLHDNPMMLHSHDGAIDYIYDHLDEFMLLIHSAHETSMKDWFKDFIAEETTAAQSLQSKWEDAGILRSNIDEKFISIISASYFRNIFDAVERGMSREDAKDFVRTLSVYYTGGWKALADQQQKNND